MPVTEIEDIIIVSLSETDPRVCDYCNETCTVWSDDFRAQVVVRECASTPYGLMCQGCLGRCDEESRKSRELRIERYASFSKGQRFPVAPIR